MSSLSSEELALFNEFLTQRFGLHFPDHKREILESRLAPRLRANRVQRFIDYYLLLQYDPDREIDELTHAVTNNESYFFRETSQFEALSGEPIRELAEQRSGPLHFLSAGCSSGEEPYTLNIFLQKSASLGLGNYSIQAIDIDQERLEMARRAVYRPGSLRALSDEQSAYYFDRIDEESYELKPRFRKGVSFSTGNIVDWSSLRGYGTVDAIFCRNVLIYFSENAIQTTIENFARLLRPGGLLFLGHSESIIGLSERFQAQRLGQCIAYRRKSE